MVYGAQCVTIVLAALKLMLPADNLVSLGQHSMEVSGL